MAYFITSLVSFLSLVRLSTCMYFPHQPEGFTVLHSKHSPGVTIFYKQTYICETSSGVKAYSGYVHLPPDVSEGRPSNVNTFFWFFESRNDPVNAPLAAWFAGGPGDSSIPAALGENGPCLIQNDSTTTKLNQYSWNNEVNMIYIDQPVQVGYSYDDVYNGTVDETFYIADYVNIADFSSGVPAVNNTFLVGSFASQNFTTANTTAYAAQAIWHLAQAFAEEFSTYKPNDNKLSIWTESYGGYYGPAFAEYFETQNDKIAEGQLSSAFPLVLDTLGIVQGFIDFETQFPYYPEYAHNNTYGIQLISDSDYYSAKQNLTVCFSLVAACQMAAATRDPHDHGATAGVNTACDDALDYCAYYVYDAFLDSGRDNFDIANNIHDPFPPKYANGYLNRDEIQSALGVPVNFTRTSPIVSNYFFATGDQDRGGYLLDIGNLLDRGVKVALMYGDRDYQCNWLGGEAASLAVNYSASNAFRSAGYANLTMEPSVNGGVVRQHGNFSFSRVFQAGHQGMFNLQLYRMLRVQEETKLICLVPYYQPETTYQIFYRTMFNLDVATGQMPVTSSYTTAGPASSFGIRNKLPAPAKTVCYLWAIIETCTSDQVAILLSANAIVHNYILVGYTSGGKTVYY